MYFHYGTVIFNSTLCSLCTLLSSINMYIILIYLAIHIIYNYI